MVRKVGMAWRAGEGEPKEEALAPINTWSMKLLLLGKGPGTES